MYVCVRVPACVLLLFCCMNPDLIYALVVWFQNSTFFQQYDLDLKIPALGDGSFSICRKCTQKRTGTAYAVKIISNQKSNCRQELQNLRRCQGHPNIVDLIEVFTDEVSWEWSCLLDLQVSLELGAPVRVIVKAARFTGRKEKQNPGFESRFIVFKLGCLHVVSLMLGTACADHQWSSFWMPKSWAICVCVCERERERERKRDVVSTRHLGKGSVRAHKMFKRMLFLMYVTKRQAHFQMLSLSNKQVFYKQTMEHLNCRFV